MGQHSKTATQELYPWRSTVRTVFQIIPGLALLVPVLITESGVPDSAAVAGALAISGAVTRIMANPAVNAFLAHWVPWLAAEPRA